MRAPVTFLGFSEETKLNRNCLYIQVYSRCEVVYFDKTPMLSVVKQPITGNEVATQYVLNEQRHQAFQGIVRLSQV